jgi:SNF family Na+-dependent transporter
MQSEFFCLSHALGNMACNFVLKADCNAAYQRGQKFFKFHNNNKSNIYIPAFCMSIHSVQLTLWHQNSVLSAVSKRTKYKWPTHYFAVASFIWKMFINQVTDQND